MELAPSYEPAAMQEAGDGHETEYRAAGWVDPVMAFAGNGAWAAVQVPPARVSISPKVPPVVLS